MFSQSSNLELKRQTISLPKIPLMRTPKVAKEMSPCGLEYPGPKTPGLPLNKKVCTLDPIKIRPRLNFDLSVHLKPQVTARQLPSNVRKL